MKILAIVPARRDSKRLPRKNILPICGKPLISWTLDSLKNLNIDQVIVSSNDLEVLDLAKASGFPSPFVRPEEFSTDDATSADVVLHALKFADNDVTHILLLQPTSPLRNESHISEAIALLKNTRSRSVMSVTPLQKPLSWLYSFEKTEDGTKKIRKINSDNLGEICYPNGALYLFEKECFLENKEFSGESCVPYVMSPEVSIDIDTCLDFKIAEVLLGERICSKI